MVLEISGTNVVKLSCGSAQSLVINCDRSLAQTSRGPSRHSATTERASLTINRGEGTQERLSRIGGPLQCHTILYCRSAVQVAHTIKISVKSGV